MQTFLPYPDFAESASVLDRLRLGKQRVETLQLLKALREGGGWSNHPAARMWRGHEAALLEYGQAICDEWTSCGYKDTCRGKMAAFVDSEEPVVYPAWLGDPALHESHRSNLYRKDPDYYAEFEGPFLEYVWPVSK